MLIKIKETFEMLEKKNTFKRYVVRCESEKFATHETADGVFVCFYGSNFLVNIDIEE